MTALITCAPPRVLPGSPAGCDHLVVLDTGPEILTGSTRLKAGSVTKLALNIITTVAFTRLGKVYGNLMVDLRATNDKLHDRAIRVLVELCPELSRTEADDVLGRADGALKVAIVMQRLDVDAPAAHALLDEVSGRLRAVLEGPPLPPPPAAPAASGRRSDAGTGIPSGPAPRGDRGRDRPSDRT